MYDPDQAALLCIKAAILTVVAATCGIILLGIDPIWIVAVMIGGVPLALLYGFIYGFLFGVTQNLDEDDLTEEDEAELLGEDEEDIEGLAALYAFEDDNGLDTEYSEEVVGTFKDATIYEYVIVNHPEKPGEKLKCHYENVVRNMDEFVVPEGWFVLLEPGILYVNRDPENTAHEDASAE